MAPDAIEEAPAVSIRRARPAAPSSLAFAAAFGTIYLIWGSTYLGIRVAVASIPPFLMVAGRFLIAGTLLFAFLRLRGVAAPTRRQVLHNSVCGVLLLLGGNALVALAEKDVASGLTTLVIGSSPFIMVLLDWWRPGGVRPRPGVFVGMTVGLSGILLLIGPGAFPAGQRPPIWSLVFLLVSATSWCLGTVYSKQIKDNAEPMMGAAIQMLAASVSTFLTAILCGELKTFSWAAVTRPSLIAFGYLVVAGSLIAYPTYVWLTKKTSAARLSTYAYVNPIVAVFLGWAILGEPLTPRIVAAGAVIIGAVAIITIQKSRGRS